MSNNNHVNAAVEVVSGDAMALTTFDEQIEAAYRLGNKPLRDEIARLTRERDDAVATAQAMADQRDWYGDMVTEAREFVPLLLDGLDRYWQAAYDEHVVAQARAWLAKPDAWAREVKPEDTNGE